VESRLKLTELDSGWGHLETLSKSGPRYQLKCSQGAGFSPRPLIFSVSGVSFTDRIGSMPGGVLISQSAARYRSPCLSFLIPSTPPTIGSLCHTPLV
jgi:hypothetical protein